MDHLPSQTVPEGVGAEPTNRVTTETRSCVLTSAQASAYTCKHIYVRGSIDHCPGAHIFRIIYAEIQSTAHNILDMNM